MEYNEKVHLMMLDENVKLVRNAVWAICDAVTANTPCPDWHKHTCGECSWGGPKIPCRYVSYEFWPTEDTRACLAFAPIPKEDVNG